MDAKLLIAWEVQSGKHELRNCEALGGQAGHVCVESEVLQHY